MLVLSNGSESSRNTLQPRVAAAQQRNGDAQHSARTAWPYSHGGAFGTHGYIDKQRDLVGVYLVQGGPVEGKYAFIRMAAAAVIE